MSTGMVLAVSFGVALILGMPIALAMALSALVALWVGGYNLEAVPLMVTKGVDSWVLLSVPFFILSANMMNTLGVSRRIFAFSQAAVGHITGGLANVSVLANMIFSGISGTAVGDMAGPGLVEYGAMTSRGYSKPFATAVVLSSSLIGPIIPPSVPFLIYGWIANVSVARLFLAGIIPGILMGLLMMATIYYLSKTGRVICPPPEKFVLRNIASTFRGGFFAILAPVFIMWGMLGGIVTPTETGLIAVVYALLLGIMYRELTWHGLLTCMKESVITSCNIMVLVGVAMAMGWVVAAERLPVLVAQQLLSMTQNKTTMLILLNILLLILGCIMEGIPIKLILLPILLPILDQVGIDRLHFGVVMTVNVIIGMATPPVGLGLFIMSSVTGLKVGDIVWAMMPFFIPLLVALTLVTFVPEISLWLPNLLMPQIR